MNISVVTINYMERTYFTLNPTEPKYTPHQQEIIQDETNMTQRTFNAECETTTTEKTTSLNKNTTNPWIAEKPNKTKNSLKPPPVTLKPSNRFEILTDQDNYEDNKSTITTNDNYFKKDETNNTDKMHPKKSVTFDLSKNTFKLFPTNEITHEKKKKIEHKNKTAPPQNLTIKQLIQKRKTENANNTHKEKNMTIDDKKYEWNRFTKNHEKRRQQLCKPKTSPTKTNRIRKQIKDIENLMDENELLFNKIRDMNFEHMIDDSDTSDSSIDSTESEGNKSNTFQCEHQDIRTWFSDKPNDE